MGGTYPVVVVLVLILVFKVVEAEFLQVRGFPLVGLHREVRVFFRWSVD